MGQCQGGRDLFLLNNNLKGKSSLLSGADVKLVFVGHYLTASYVLISKKEMMDGLLLMSVCCWPRMSSSDVGLCMFLIGWL